MYTIEKTIKKLNRLIQENNFEPFSITMKCNGDVLIIRPISYSTNNITDINQVDSIKVEHSPNIPWLGGSPDVFADELNHYEEYIKGHHYLKNMLNNLRQQLQAAYNKNLNEEEIAEWKRMFGTYSDHYKDVYGYRPSDVEYPLCIKL